MKYKVLTAGSGNTAEFKAGCPSGWPLLNFAVADDETLTPEEIARGFFFATPSEYTLLRADNANAYSDWIEAQQRAQDSLDDRSDTYTITKAEFLGRLSDEELLTIQQLATTNPQVSRLWATFNALTEGIAGPPDGTTPERALAQAAFGLCTQLFGVDEANRLFSKPQ